MTTFILVHGAGTGGWLWDGVADLLRAAGHVVHAPTLLGVGDRAAQGGPATSLSDHVDDVVGVIVDRELESVVLVGFSYGGLVIAGAADERPDAVAELVFVDAFLPRPGHSFLDLLPPAARDRMEAAARDGDGWRIPPAPVEQLGGIGRREPGVDAEDVEARLALRGAQPIGTYRSIATAPTPAGAALPRRYVSCTDKPPGDPLVDLAARLRADGWTVQDIPTGHFAMLTMPTALAALLSADPR